MRLICEEDREAHIARHDISIAEAEDVVEGNHVRLRMRQGLLGLVGMTSTGRLITVIVAREKAGLVALVTARDADHRERTVYHRYRRRR